MLLGLRFRTRVDGGIESGAVADAGGVGGEAFVVSHAGRSGTSQKRRNWLSLPTATMKWPSLLASTW